MIRKGILRIGTSNIVLPGNKQSFPPAFREASRLHYYSSLFDTVEVNSSFYKVPLPATFEKWAANVPEKFQFTIKLWREITHAKKLVFDLHHIDHFLTAAGKLGSKKGCLLIQFPGKITLEYYSKVEQILQHIQKNDPANEWRMAVEFRHKSWYVSETLELLDEFHAGMVLHDMKGSANSELTANAAFVNARFHGPAGDYRGSYEDAFLKDQWHQMQQWVNKGKDVYAYFNNTIGNAFENARRLKTIAGMG